MKNDLPKRDEVINFKPGEQIKNYRVLDKDENASEKASALGEGGSGVVYLAEQMLHESVSIKRAIKFFMYRDDIAELSAHKQTSPVSQKDFLSEIVNISSFSHENLIKVIDAGVHIFSGLEIPFIVTDYIEGPTLKDIIERKNQEVLSKINTDPSVIFDMLIKIGNGLTHLHKKRFSHCDIAPKNIFLNAQEEFKPIVGDLGIAKNLSRERTEVFVAGTRRYMPPEVLSYRNSFVDWKTFMSFHPRWDVYAFAVIGIELLALIPDELGISWKKPLFIALNNCSQGERYTCMENLLERIHFLQPMNREVATVPELSSSVSGTFRKLMPVEALTTSRRIQSLIQHPAVTRLEKVKQLTTANQVFPGATHSRYEHSLGVMETIRRYVIALIDQDEFLEHLSKEKIETALLCGLFSNISRFPMSNIVHEIKKKNESKLSLFSKESLLDDVFSIKDNKDRTLPELIEEKYPSVNVDTVKNILLGRKAHFDNEDHMIYSFLNSSLDARVIDFVRRDSLHVGITTGDPFDLNELLPHLTIKNHRLALFMRGVTVAEQIISLRYWLFNRIYWCRPNRAYVAMLRFLIMELLENKEFSNRLRERVLKHTDRRFLRYLYNEAVQSEQLELIDLSRLLIQDQQELFAVSFDISVLEAPDLVSAWKKIEMMDHAKLKKLCCALGDVVRTFVDDKEMCENKVNVLVDIPQEPGSNKLGEDIMVLRPNSEQPEALTRVSAIVRGANENFNTHLRRLRVFIHPSLRPEKEKQNVLRKGIEEYLLKHLT